MSNCPFESEEYTLDINTPCPVCGMLGSFIYDNPGDNTCVANAERAAQANDAVSGSVERGNE